MNRPWLLEQLPGVMADDDFLVRFVGIFQEIADSVRSQADGFENLLDTAVAPPEFVRYMGKWIGFTVDSSIPDDRMRDLVKAGGLLFPWRGTQLGLAGLIETVTGYTATIEESGGVFAEGAAPPNDHHVVIRVGGTGAMTREQLTGLVADELPVDVTYDLIIGDEGPVVAPPPPFEPPPFEPPPASRASVPAPGEPAGEEPQTEGRSLSERVDRLLAAARADPTLDPEPAPPEILEDQPGDELGPLQAEPADDDDDDGDAKPRFTSWWDGWGDDVDRRDEPGDGDDRSS